jgi:hypothetical protein
MTYHTTAKGLAALGRNGDSMLMHVNPQEVAALSHILGPISVNPKTGLPEAYSWTNMLGSVVGGLGSFGVGAALEPVIGDLVGDSGLFSDVLKKAVPAVAGAGIGAAIGGATGGKAGAMGGAAQGALSGGIGAYASDDVLGSGTTPPANNVQAVEQQANKDATTSTANALYNTSDAKPNLYKPSILDENPPSVTSMPVSASADYKPNVGTNYTLQSAGTDGTGGTSNFLNNLNTVGHNALSSGGMDNFSDYLPYLFQAGLIGNTVTAQQQGKTITQQNQQRMADYAHAQQVQAQNLAQQTYAGYASGGGVHMQNQGPLPVSVHIPEQLVEKVKDSGGLSTFLQGQRMNADNYATGGYVNTQPFNAQDFYPQSRIASAQPYAAAGNTSVVNTLANGASFAHGGLIDGDGDGMSDSIDASINGEEPVRVADGEYTIPKHVVDMIGTERLDKLLKDVRKAAFGTDKQIKQNAALNAAKAGLGV